MVLECANSYTCNMIHENVAIKSIIANAPAPQKECRLMTFSDPI